MMFDVHPLHPSRPSPSRKPNRENRIKNACFSNSHSNIALSNDKRPLFVQILATSSASLVSTSLPIQCLRPSNFFFFRRIFLNSFLCHQNLITQELKILVRHRNLITRQLLVARASSKFDHSRAKNTRASSTIPLKSRRADVEASGLIVRRKRGDTLSIASSVKGRKVRS